MCFDVDKCIGCGLCVDACKKENHVPEAAHYFRTWIERYIIKKPKPGSDRLRGEVLVDSPNGGRDGFAPTTVPREEILKSFFVPKLCNLCESLALHAGVPGGGHVRHAGRRGAGGPELLHRLRLLHPGLPVRLPLLESGNQDGGEMHALLSPHHARAEAGLRGNLPDRGAHFRRLEESGGRTIRFRRSSRRTRCSP